jgi:short-subunit dehydrogenase
MHMKLLITGATGYIGYKLAMEAARRNYTVHILARDPRSSLMPVHSNIKYSKVISRTKHLYWLL